MRISQAIWIFTTDFEEAFFSQDSLRTVEHPFISTSPRDYNGLQTKLKEVKAGRVEKNVCIWDLARMRSNRVWDFVKDGINRSGSNPLREMDSSRKYWFVDVSRLYQVPEGYQGIEIISLGERFHEGDISKLAVCGHLQTLAIVAHGMKFDLTGIVVEESKIADLKMDEIMCIG